MDIPISSLPKPKPLKSEPTNNKTDKTDKTDKKDAGKSKKLKTVKHLDKLFSKDFQF